VRGYATEEQENEPGISCVAVPLMRSVGEGRTQVEALDPHVMVTLTGNDGLEAVAGDAASRLSAALRRLE